jgi:hypothetical protein
MRTLSFDQFEFDPPDSEQALVISIAARDEHIFPDVADFARAVWGDEDPGKLSRPVPFAEDIGPGNVRAYLRQYAGVALPTPCHWPTYVLADEWNDWEAVLAGPTIFLRYHWWTTA